MAGLGPAQHRLGLGLAVAEPRWQWLHRVTVGEDPVDRRLKLRSAHAEGRVRGHGADEVAAGEGRLPGGEPMHAEDVHRPLHVEAARLQRTGLTTEHRLHRLAVEPDARGTLVPAGEEILGGRDLVLALAGVEGGHLAPGACGHVIRGRSGVDLERPARELTPLRIGDADDREAALAVDHGGDAELAHQTVAPFRLGDGSGRGGVLVQGLAVQLAPAPVRSLHPGRDGDVGVQLRIDGDRAGGRIGDRAGGAMHELGHDQLGAHRLGGLGLRVVLARPAGVGLEILGGSLDSLAVDAQDGGPRALVTERVEDAHVLGR